MHADATIPGTSSTRSRVASIARRALTPFLLLVWAAMTAGACAFVARSTTAVPFADDMEFVSVLPSGASQPWEWYWDQANEHRVVLPRFFLMTLLRAFGDIRAGMYFQIALQSALALGLMLFARRLRGRASAADAVFPLLLVHWGNPENLLLGMAIATPLTPIFVCAFLACALWRPGAPTAARALGMVAALLAMPFNGGFGLMTMPPLVAWCSVAGVVLARDRRTRTSSAILLAGVAGSIALVAWYFTGFEFPASNPHTHSPWLVLRTVYLFQGLALGAKTDAAPYACAAVALVLAIPGAWLAARAWKRGPVEERWRASAIVATVLAVLSLACAIGISRTTHGELAGLANRYVHLPSPIWIAAFLSTCLYGRGTLAKAAQLAMLATQLVVFNANVAFGAAVGGERIALSTALQADVDARVPIDELGRRYAGPMYPTAEGLAARLRILRRRACPPFEPGATREGASELGWLQRGVVRAPDGSIDRLAYDEQVLAVRGVASIEYALGADVRRVATSYGMLPSAWRNATARSAGMRFEVVLARAGGAEETLFDRTLRPATEAKDRGIQRVELDLPEGSKGTLTLRTSPLAGGDPAYDWGFWSDPAAR